MGKSVGSANRLQDLARGITVNPRTPTRFSGGGVVVRMESGSGSGSGSESRTGLGEVVSECVRRWFQETLKEAKGGDSSMQVLVAQMYYSGYGVPKDPHKGRLWINRASKSRSSVWKVGEKRPGYNASDSDSDEIKEEAK